MAKGKQHTGDSSKAAATSRTVPARGTIVLVVVIGFLLLLVVKLVADGSAPTDAAAPPGGQTGTTITSVRNDAVGDYEAAAASGKPIYVLFHSFTCVPCVEISEVADAVIPEYEGEIVFVNAITDDPSGQQLSSGFSFQYIPTSFFMAPGGESVVDSYTGAMDEAQMRAYLDDLIAAQ